MQAEFSIGEDPSDMEVFLSSSKAFRGVVAAQEQVAEVLREDCYHVLRKAQAAVNKAAKA